MKTNDKIDLLKQILAYLGNTAIYKVKPCKYVITTVIYHMHMIYVDDTLIMSIISDTDKLTAKVINRFIYEFDFIKNELRKTDLKKYYKENTKLSPQTIDRLEKFPNCKTRTELSLQLTLLGF